MSKTNYRVLKEYYHIWEYIIKQYASDKTREEYGISYDYDKDIKSITYIIGDYYSDYGDKSKKIQLNEEDFNALVELLQTNSFKVSHHYIYIENKLVKRKNK